MQEAGTFGLTQLHMSTGRGPASNLPLAGLQVPARQISYPKQNEMWLEKLLPHTARITFIA